MNRRSLPALGLLLALSLAIAACGDGASAPGSGPAAAPTGGPCVGQEIWISYGPAKQGELVRRTGRSREEAEKLARALHRQVRDGGDIGALARKHSNMLGGSADGFTGLLPQDARAPDERDRALAALPVGGLSPVLDWYDGFWFARRVSMERGQELEQLFQRMRRLRTRFRSIALLYAGAWIPDAEVREKVTRTRTDAVAQAEYLLKLAQTGRDFAELARLHSEDGPSAARGGIVAGYGRDGRLEEWLRRQEPGVPDSVLEAAFATPVGEVYPHVIISPRGVFVVKVEGRKEVGQ